MALFMLPQQRKETLEFLDQIIAENELIEQRNIELCKEINVAKVSIHKVIDGLGSN